jgi:hypothetical protein
MTIDLFIPNNNSIAISIERTDINDFLESNLLISVLSMEIRIPIYHLMNKSRIIFIYQ